ncbi:MAG: hypothetical protein WAO02_17550 [Verrucomicrobiia bacterium]
MAANFSFPSTGKDMPDRSECKGGLKKRWFPDFKWWVRHGARPCGRATTKSGLRRYTRRGHRSAMPPPQN